VVFRLNSSPFLLAAMLSLHLANSPANLKGSAEAGEEERARGSQGVVTIECNNKTRLDWLLGVVVSLSPGSDGCVQVVTVKTALGELTRPLQCVFSMDKPEGLSAQWP